MLHQQQQKHHMQTMSWCRAKPSTAMQTPQHSRQGSAQQGGCSRAARLAARALQREKKQ
jgi:hypothetical protein